MLAWPRRSAICLTSTPCVHHSCRQAVTKQVSPLAWRQDSGAQEVLADDVPDSVGGGDRPQRGPVSHEDVRNVQTWTSAEDVLGERRAQLLRQWKGPLSTALGLGQPDLAGSPLDLGELEIAHLLIPHAEGGDRQQHRPVAQTQRGARVHAVDQRPHLSPGKVARDRLQAPVGQRWDHTIEVDLDDPFPA